MRSYSSDTKPPFQNTVKSLRRIKFRPCLEILEDRYAPAVTPTNLLAGLRDTVTNVTNGLIQQAIQGADAVLPVINTRISELRTGVENAIDGVTNGINRILTGNDTASQQTRLNLTTTFNPPVPDEAARNLAASALQAALAPYAQNVRVIDLQPEPGIAVVQMDLVVPLVDRFVSLGTALRSLPVQLGNGSLTLESNVRYEGMHIELQNNQFVFRANTSQTNELQLTLDAGLAHNTSFSAEIGFLRGTAIVNPAGVGLHGKLVADVSSNLAVSNPRYEGLAAVADLQLTAEFTTNNADSGIAMPRLRTDFRLDWDLSGARPNDPDRQLGSAPTVAFRNVSVGLGSMLSNTIGPIVKTIQQLSGPVQPVLDLLGAPIPGLSDVGIGEVNLLKLAKLAQSSGTLPPHIQLMTKIALEIATLHSYVSRIDIPGDEVFINLGNYNLTGPNGEGDLRQFRDKAKRIADLAKSPNLQNLSDLKGLLTTGARTLLDMVNEVRNQIPESMRGLVDQWLTQTGFMNQLLGVGNGVKLSFPFVDDPVGGVVKILLGQAEGVKFVEFTADLIAQLPETELINFPVWGPVRGNAVGSIDIELHFGVKYDAVGLRNFLARGATDARYFAQGLAFDTVNTNPLARYSRDLVHVKANIGAGAYLPFPVGAVVPGPFGFPITAEVRVGPRGSLSGELGVRLADPDGEGVIRPLFNPAGSRPEHLFEVSGKLDANIKLLVEAWFTGVKLFNLYERPLLEKTLFDTQNIDTSNPFRPPAQWGFASFPVRRETFFVNSNGGRLSGPANDVSVRLNGDQIEVLVNNVVRKSYSRLETISLQVVGTRHDDNFTVRAIPVDVAILGGSGNDSLTLDDRVPWLRPQMTYTVTDTRVRAGFFTGDIENIRDVNHSSIENVHLITPSRSNTINVNSLPDVPFTIQTTPLYTSPRSGWNRLATFDPYDISSEFPSVNMINIMTSALHNRAKLTIDGRSNTDLVTVRENLPMTSTNYSIHSDRVVRTGIDEFFLFRTATVYYSGVDSLQVIDQWAGALGRNYDVVGLHPSTPVSITGGGGRDIFRLGNQLDSLSGPDILHESRLTINGGGGIDDLFIDDSLSTDAAVDQNGVSIPTSVISPVWSIGSSIITRQNTVQDLQLALSSSYYLRIEQSGIEALSVTGSGGQDVFSVSAVSPGQNFSVDSRAGNDEMLVGPFVIDALSNTLTFDGGEGTDRLIVRDDFGNPHPLFGTFYQVSDNLLFARGRYLGYPRVENLDLTTTSFDDYVQVQSLPASNSFSVNTAAGDDYITLDSLSPILGTVSLTGGSGSDSLVVSDFGNASIQTFSVTNSSVTPGSSNPISYAELETLDLHAGSGGAQFFVASTPWEMTTNLYGYEGAHDEFRPGWGSDLNQVLGTVNSFGQSADLDYAVYYDYLNPSPQTYTISSAGSRMSIERPGTGRSNFTDLIQVVFYAPRGGGSIENVLSVPSQTFLNMAIGGDAITLGSNAPNLGGNLAGILGPVSVAAYVDANATMIVDNSDDINLASRRITLRERQGQFDYGDHIEGFAPATIYTRMGNNSTVQLLGSAADETFAIRSPVFETNFNIDGGGGINTLDYSSPLAAIPGQVSWYKAEGNTLDSIGSNHGIPYLAGYGPGRDGQAFRFVGDYDHVRVPNSPSLSPGTLSVEAWVRADSFASGYIVAKGVDEEFNASYGFSLFDGLSFVVFDGDQNWVASPYDGQIYDGNWHHLIGTYDGSHVRLYVDGTEVGDGTPTSLTIGYNLAVSNDLYIGGIDGTLAFAGSIDDLSIFNRALSASEVQDRFFGSGGTANGPGVYVNLPARQATGLNDVTRIQKVIGSSGNDIIVGNGDNILFGGAGRDLLIAGALGSLLIGGDGDDLLIGGTTSYDNNRTALDTIMAEWSRTDISYDQRVSNLVNGSGVPALNATTVHRNGGTNQLTGGLGDDLFFAQLATELIDFQNPQETWISV